MGDATSSVEAVVNVAWATGRLKKRILSVLEQILAKEDLPGEVRSGALARISNIAPVLGKKLARTFHNSPDLELQGMAKYILSEQ